MNTEDKIKEILEDLGHTWPPNEDIMLQWERVDVDPDTLSEEDLL